MALFLGAYYSNVTFMDVILRLLNPTNLYITSGAWFMENDIHCHLQEMNSGL